MPRVSLTAEDLAAIAAAEPGSSPQVLARRLGCPFTTVYRALKRLQTPEGWSCPLRWTTCSECGGPLASRPQHRTTHPHCLHRRSARRWRARTRQQPQLATHYRRARHERDPAAHEHELATQRRQAAARLARVAPGAHPSPDAGARGSPGRRQRRRPHAAVDRPQPWTPAEDAYLLAHPHERLHDLAVSLQRTYSAVRERRAFLHRHGVAPAARDDIAADTAGAATPVAPAHRARPAPNPPHAAVPAVPVLLAADRGLSRSFDEIGPFSGASSSIHA